MSDQPQLAPSASGPPAFVTPKKVGNPGKRATYLEYSDRIDHVITLLRSGYRFDTIVHKVAKKYDLSRRMAEIYISHARAAIIRDTEKPKEEHIADSLATYKAVKRHPDSTPRDIISAQKAIDELLGLEKQKTFRVQEDKTIEATLRIETVRDEVLERIAAGVVQRNRLLLEPESESHDDGHGTGS